MADLPVSTTETKTTLYSNLPPIKKKNFKSWYKTFSSINSPFSKDTSCKSESRVSATIWQNIKSK